MYSTRWVQVVMVVLSILIATQASWFHHGLAARQDSVISVADSDSDSDSSSSEAPSSDVTSSSPPSSTSSSSSPTSSSQSTTTTDEPTTSSTPTPTSSSSSSSRSSASTTSSNTGPITTAPSSTPTTSSSPTSTEGDSNPDTTKDTKSSTTAKPVTQTQTVFYTSTDNSGQTHVGSSESVVVSTPGLTGGGSSSGGSSGISPQVRSTIIGVTVGVGGAIILAAGGILYWRLRNKRRSQEENEELISYGAGFAGPGTAEKSEASGPTASARSPFQSTLETYHAPTQTNAASNF
ncbi:hypothetical protein ONZ43_g1738 [Nemania bipapillata]|uniref:Uncharacterized protein n=1 Tax=Nemania bipapillata TaxID=110536 RepID=A0ACC2J3F7_9PEZI|nr:hypothetical protein ONZ43_g1738 [Nemania bipapillata]